MSWQRFYHKFFVEMLQEMHEAVERLKITNPNSYKKSTHAKIFESILATVDFVGEDPTRREFLLGNTLGEKNRDWRRAKRLLPPRYRLFFKFFLQHNEIYYAWFNGARSLRHEGSKKDVYYIFRSMLDRGEMASDREALKDCSSESMS
jgi:toxin YhaV